MRHIRKQYHRLAVGIAVGLLGLLTITSWASAAGAAGGIISGVVTWDKTIPDFEPQVDLFDLAGTLIDRCVPDLATGVYQFPCHNTILSGTYKVRFTEGPHGYYRSQDPVQTGSSYYAGQFDFDSATLISVTQSQTLTHINGSIESLGPEFKLVTSSAFTNVLLASSAREGLPLYSLDGGSNWLPIAQTPWFQYAPGRPENYELTLVPRPVITAPVRFIVGARNEGDCGAEQCIVFHYRVYRTGDLGQTWSDEAAAGKVLQLIASPARAERVYRVDLNVVNLGAPLRAEGQPATVDTPLQRLNEDQASFANIEYALATSDDAGVNWQSRSLTIKAETLVPSPLLPDRVYASDKADDDHLINTPRWWQSDDAGQTWTEHAFPVVKLALDGVMSSTLYGMAGMKADEAQSSLGPFTGTRSLDSGITWTAWPQQPCRTSFIQLLALSQRASTLLMLCEQGVYRSSDGGQIWQHTSSLRGTKIAPDYGNPGHAFLIGPTGLWRSQDEGVTWQLLNTATFATKPQAYLPFLTR